VTPRTSAPTCSHLRSLRMGRRPKRNLVPSTRVARPQSAPNIAGVSVGRHRLPAHDRSCRRARCLSDRTLLTEEAPRASHPTVPEKESALRRSRRALVDLSESQVTAPAEAAARCRSCRSSRNPIRRR
jgi:hypothetical protein